MSTRRVHGHRRRSAAGSIPTSCASGPRSRFATACPRSASSSTSSILSARRRTSACVRERPGFEEYARHKWSTLSPVMWSELAVEIATQPDLLPSLAAVTCPTLVIVGEQDQAFIEPSFALADTIADARLVVVPDAGHSPQFENPGCGSPPSTGSCASSRRSGAGGLLQEAGPLDDDPGDAAGRHEPVPVAHRHPEGQPPALRSSRASPRRGPCRRPPWARGGRVARGTRRSSCPRPACPSIARTDASSASRTTRGVASTGTSPVFNAIAVSSSVTTRSAVADRPGRGGIGLR